MTYAKQILVLATVNELRTVSTTVPAWEAPLLDVTHRECEMREAPPREYDELPDPAAEYQRLANKYKPVTDDDERAVRPVAVVYGPHGAGVSALARAMQQAIVHDQGTAPDDSETPRAAPASAPAARAQPTRAAGGQRKKKKRRRIAA